MNFFFLLFSILFYQYTTLSIHAVNGHQMHSGGSVESKASTISIDSPIPPLIFTGDQVRNLAPFPTSLNFEPPAFQSPALYLTFLM